MNANASATPEASAFLSISTVRLQRPSGSYLASSFRGASSPMKRPRYLTVPLRVTPSRTSIHCDSRPPTSSPEPSAPLSMPLSLALLNVTAVLWGTQHAVIKFALSDISPSTLNAARFAIAAMLSAPGLRGVRMPAVRRGAELSAYLFAGYALQSAALLTTSASRSAFLLYLNVKLVPLAARLLYGRRIAPATWASAAVALAGTALLTYDGSPPAVGDLFSVAAAAASALFILRTEAATADIDVSPAALNATTLAGVAVLTAVWSGGAAFVDMIQHGGAAVAAHTFALPSGQSAAAVAYLAIVTTAICNYIQAVGQRGVSAERAAIVFAMDPVYGAFFAYLLLGETLGPQGFAGALLIFGAAALSAVGAAISPSPAKPADSTANSVVLDDSQPIGKDSDDVPTNVTTHSVQQVVVDVSDSRNESPRYRNSARTDRMD